MDLNIKDQKSIAGLRANAAAFLINLSFFIPGINLIVPIVSLILERDNAFVRNYAILGTFVFLGLLLVFAIFQIIATIYAFMEKEFKIPHLEKVVDLLFID